MGWMVLSVGVGGAFCAICRYLISLWVTGSFGQAGWMAILSVNVAGSLIMGVMAALLTVSSLFNDPVLGFVMIGFLGALTTFSIFVQLKELFLVLLLAMNQQKNKQRNLKIKDLRRLLPSLKIGKYGFHLKMFFQSLN